MTKISVYFFFLGLLSIPCIAQSAAGAIDTTQNARESVQSRKAILVATEFTNDLIKGVSAETLASHCAVPFCHDDSILITTTTELKAFFESLLSTFSQGVQKNHPRFDSARVYGVESGVLHGLIPVNIYITVVNIKFNIHGQQPSAQLVFAVQMSDNGKIVGVSN